METSAPGWYVDPTGRHEHRYWTGSRWSDQVDDPTGPSSDPLEPLFADLSPDPHSRRRPTAPGPAPAAVDPTAVAASAGLEASGTEVTAASRRLARRRGRLAPRRAPASPAAALPPGPPARRRRAARRATGSGDEVPATLPADPDDRRVRAARRAGDEVAGAPEAGVAASRRVAKGRLADVDPRRRRYRPALLVLMVAGGLVLGAIVGGIVVVLLRTDEGQAAVSEPPDPLYDTLSAYIGDTAMGAVSEQDAACMAGSIIESVGRDRLIEVGVDQGADPLTTLRPEEVQTHLPVAMECLDDTSVEAMIARTLKTTVLGRFNVSSGECLAHGWMEQLGRPTLVEVYALWASGGSADLPALLSPPELEVLATVLSACSAE